MSEKFSIAFNLDQNGGHPHDLLARLYREIGISAVAAALEVVSEDSAAEAPARDASQIPAFLQGEDLAA